MHHPRLSGIAPFYRLLSLFVAPLGRSFVSEILTNAAVRADSA